MFRFTQAVNVQCMCRVTLAVTMQCSMSQYLATCPSFLWPQCASVPVTVLLGHYCAPLTSTVLLCPVVCPCGFSVCLLPYFSLSKGTCYWKHTHINRGGLIQTFPGPGGFRCLLSKQTTLHYSFPSKTSFDPPYQGSEKTDPPILWWKIKPS